MPNDLEVHSTFQNANRIKAANARYQWHPMVNPNRLIDDPPLIIVRGRGSVVEDINGAQYVDGVAGLWCVNVGHGHPEVIEAIRRQLGDIAYYSPFDGTATPPSILLSERLIGMTAQENMARVMFSLGGSDSIETAMKIARQYWRLSGEPDRVKFISLRNAYHGVHFGGLSMNGSPVFKQNYEPLLGGCSQVDTPWLYRNPWTQDAAELGRICADILEREIQHQGPHTVAAFFAEPIQGAGGVIVPPENYWPLVREVCDRYGVLLVSDEIVTGFGRSGAMFGARGWGVRPDIMCVAKGLSSGYVPLGATLFNERIAKAWDGNATFDGAIMHGYTYTGHAVACAAALACLDIVEAQDLPGNAAARGAELLALLKPLQESHSLVGDVRGKGLMIAIDLVSDKATREPIDPAGGQAYALAEAARAHGAIVRPVGTKLILSPPLVITADEIEQLAGAVLAAFASNAGR
ncbi:MAG: aminotransferase class III-fold pyridoxal phosphate-dependent enzyme [Phenylobacterium sp.]|uniref:aminotransferase class III-fold pyridoxal phosphate-dependent enzyme n=1 Tax=Phenylobacterium sp. TaxID=1871053 RepID=UPI0027333005|nr:aminotransferase class III-fold pyridoxal phosphate-dependent enzyme [Phenylobacterium sp.]MDP3749535.1 aminotransferase class III-fold pyridoxal phosphate-dependent enzyme [Phenylobacterium sp.]